MRLLEYRILDHGAPERTARGTAADLLCAIPYAIVGGLIPPRVVLNELLASGEVDAGMSGACRWKPFRLSESEFHELVSRLSRRPDRGGRGLRFESPPAWVTTRLEWEVWLAERLHGVPAAENLQLRHEIARLRESVRASAAEGDRLGRARHWVELSLRLARLVALQAGRNTETGGA